VHCSTARPLGSIVMTVTVTMLDATDAAAADFAIAVVRERCGV
jgi:hypothetical protein